MNTCWKSVSLIDLGVVIELLLEQKLAVLASHPHHICILASEIKGPEQPKFWVGFCLSISFENR